MRALCDSLTTAPGDCFPCTVSLDPKQPMLMVTEGGGQKQPGMYPWEAGFSSRLPTLFSMKTGSRVVRTHCRLQDSWHKQLVFPVKEGAVQRDRNLHWPKSCFRLGNE